MRLCFLPLLLLALPAALANSVLAESSHYGTLAALLPFAATAFWLGFRQHRSIVPVMVGLPGIICLELALMSDVSQGMEGVLTVAGSVLRFAGHLGNWWLRAKAA